MSGVAKISPWLDTTFEINTKKKLQKKYFFDTWIKLEGICWCYLTIGFPCCFSWFNKTWDRWSWGRGLGQNGQKKGFHCWLWSAIGSFYDSNNIWYWCWGLNVYNWSNYFSPTLSHWYWVSELIVWSLAVMHRFRTTMWAFWIFKSQINALAEKWPAISEENPLLMSDGGFEVSDWSRYLKL